MQDPTQRFSPKAESYDRYRPSYPGELIQFIQSQIPPQAVLADLGSGTGILSVLLAPIAREVLALEPNQEMRQAAEMRFKAFPQIRSVDAPAEATGLPEASLDAITAAQAFHWFDQGRCKVEFQRILKPGAPVFLIWNKRNLASPFLQDYERIVSGCIPEYALVNHHNVKDADIGAFFDGSVEYREFAYTQVFDFEGVMGRLGSASYMPGPETEAYRRIEALLRLSFEEHVQEGFVRFEYRTQVYRGQWSQTGL